MKTLILQLAATFAVIFSSPASGFATDLTLHLSGNGPVSRNTVRYQCDQKAAAVGLPTGAFSVEYVNGQGNSLAIVPVGGSSLIFANVSSGSGARYAAGQYIWWDAGGRGTTFSSDSLSGHAESACHKITTP